MASADGNPRKRKQDQGDIMGWQISNNCLCYMCNFYFFNALSFGITGAPDYTRRHQIELKFLKFPGEVTPMGGGDSLQYPPPCLLRQQKKVLRAFPELAQYKTLGVVESRTVMFVLYKGWQLISQKIAIF